MPIAAPKKKQDLGDSLIPLAGTVVGGMIGGPAGASIGGTLGSAVAADDSSDQAMLSNGADIMSAMRRRKGTAAEASPEADVAKAYQAADAMGPEGDKYKPTLAQALAKAEREKATQQTSMYEYE